MKRMPRASRISRSVASGSMTTRRSLSKVKWRSISGRVPLPIEPKPIITIGPVIRPWTGQAGIAESLLGRRRRRRLATGGI
jgi:hypothetical protein